MIARANSMQVSCCRNSLQACSRKVLCQESGPASGSWAAVETWLLMCTCVAVGVSHRHTCYGEGWLQGAWTGTVHTHTAAEAWLANCSRVNTRIQSQGPLWQHWLTGGSSRRWGQRRTQVAEVYKCKNPWSPQGWNLQGTLSIHRDCWSPHWWRLPGALQSRPLGAAVTRTLWLNGEWWPSSLFYPSLDVSVCQSLRMVKPKQVSGSAQITGEAGCLPWWGEVSLSREFPLGTAWCRSGYGMVQAKWNCSFYLFCVAVVVVAWSLSCIWLFATSWTVAHQAPLSMGFPKNTRVGWHFLLHLCGYSQVFCSIVTLKFLKWTPDFSQRYFHSWVAA